MHILFARFPLESRFGGAEVQTLSLMKGLQERGHEVAFLGSCPTLLREVPKIDIAVTKLEIGKPPVTKWNALSFLWGKTRMKQQLLNALLTPHSSLTTVVMLSLSEKLLATEELAKQGHPVFWIEHDRIGNWLRMNPWLPLLRRMSRFATIIVVSELSKKIYVDLGFDSQRIVVIPNGIDLKKFDPSRYPPSATHSHVGTVARLTSDKGADVLIDSVTDIPEANLTIIGTGPEEGFLRKLIIDRNLSDRIVIKPNIADLPSFYSSLDVFVLPSRDHDPFGLVAAEAMAMGIPVIVTDACGIASMLRHEKDALIVPAESSRALREAISSLLRDASLRQRLGAAGKETAHATFALETMIDRYETLLGASRQNP